ncbi:glycosyltransferase family 4 protein [Candidatus Bathyarchaeota archaeon]|nr:glycosyltransferase family 4 protein [Candidatus Bathyarchaeota archaeon]
MRIVFVVPYFGFPGVVSDTLAGHLAKRGHEIVLVGYLGRKNSLMFQEEALRLKEENIQCFFPEAVSISIPSLVTEFPYFLSFKELLEEIQPDIVHINCLPFLTSFQSAKVAKKTHWKSVLQVHGVIVQRGFFFNILQETYNYTFGHSTFSNADRVICLTTSDAEKVSRYGCSPEKLQVIPNGVDVDKFRPMNGETSGLLLWCGRFVHEKGLEYLIRAFEFIRRKSGGQTVKLTMAGDGPLFPRILQLAEKSGLGRTVSFIGPIPRKEIPSLMNKSSIYVLPSLNEGMPYALLEAMACGKPVIGSDIPGIRDVITHGQNGILVPPRSPEAFANAILELLEDGDKRRRLGQKARELMVKEYSWDAVTREVEMVYSEMLNS